MKTHRWAEIPVEQLNAQMTRQVIHGDGLTIARLILDRGAVVPRHAHVNEQISTIESGRLKFIFDHAEVTLLAGESLQIPSNVPHAAEALERTVALDVFTPVREDWVRGDDAYLRSSTSAPQG